MKKGVFAQGVMWFGAAVSVAEIGTGLEFSGNWKALVCGHLLGGLLLFAVGLLGARSDENAMETTRSTFGRRGMRFFALLNVVQLIGWTTVMLSQGAAAVTALAGSIPTAVCIVVLALLISMFFDAYSAGESMKAMTLRGDAGRGDMPDARVNPKDIGVAVCALGAVLAMTGFVDRYAEFLYAIASVFAPMAAVLLVDRYIVRKHCVAWNFVSWAAGTAAYYLADGLSWSSTVTSMTVAAVCALVAFRPLRR